MANLFTNGYNGTFDFTNDPNGNPPSDWGITKGDDVLIGFEDADVYEGTGAMRVNTFDDSFMFSINIPTNGGSFTLPLISAGSNYNFEVNWGDGTNDTITSWNQAEKTHVYATLGVKNISIKGTLIGWSFEIAGGVSADLMVNISRWGGIKYNTFGAYRDCVNMDVSATDIPDFSETTGVGGFFRNCPSLVFNDSINNWNVSGINNFELMFFGCTLFNKPLNNWNMSNAENLQNMFQNSGFNQNIGNWNLPLASTFRSMFRNTPFNQNIGNWNISNLNNADDMFRDNTALSTENYQNLLIGWGSQSTIQSNVLFSAGSATYFSGSLAENYRDSILIGIFNWTITDGGTV